MYQYLILKGGYHTMWARICIRLGLVLVVLISMITGESNENEYYFKISAKEIATIPISPLLYSNFIELGYGVQAEAMWSEMLFNRSFEYVYPYTGINKECFDLYLDGGTPGEIYARDWSVFDWYHSGYEHNAWFVAPGTLPLTSWIDDTSTFFSCQSPVVKCELRLEKEGSGHGDQCLRIINHEEKRWAGVAQTGKYLKKGEIYYFRGKIKSFNSARNFEIRFYETGKWEKSIAAFPLSGTADQFSEVSIEFNNSWFEGWATFSFMIPPQSEIMIDDFSLKPKNTISGWRPDVVEVTKKVNPGLIRFPGGCFASFYDWRDGIGPYSDRKPKVSYFWGGLNYNDIGTAEFAMFCKAVNTQMMFCVNVYHPWKQSYEHYQGTLPGLDFPEFTSITEGAKVAADWVAYCNLPAGTHPMADLRVKHGYKEPFAVRYWELDNEVSRWFHAKDYAWAAVIYSNAMKAVDPSIKIGMVVYGGGWKVPSYKKQLDEMLDIAGKHIDFLADRNDAEEGLDAMLVRLKEYNSQNNTHIEYCNTEWLPLDFDKNIQVYLDPNTGCQQTRSYMFSKWHYGMNVLKNLMAFQRRGGEVSFVNFNNLANTHSQSAIETPKEGAYLTASGMALDLMSHSPAAWVLEIENYVPKVADEFQVQACWDNQRKKLVLYVCNRTFKNKKVKFDLSALSKTFTKSDITTLTGGGPLAMNTLKNPHTIRQTIKSYNKLKINKHYSIEIEPYTFIQIVLEE